MLARDVELRMRGVVQEKETFFFFNLFVFNSKDIKKLVEREKKESGKELSGTAPAPPQPQSLDDVPEHILTTGIEDI